MGYQFVLPPQSAGLKTSRSLFR